MAIFIIRRILAKALLLCLITHVAFSQQLNNSSTLTIDEIMAGEKFVGFVPEGVFWGDDSRAVYFSWNPRGDTLRSTYKIAVDGAEPQELGFAEQKELSGGAGAFNKAKTLKVFSKGGDLFLLNLSTGERRRLTQTVDRESNPVFSGDERLVVFERDGNLYALDPANGTVRQLTNFRRGNEQKDPPKTAQRKWLEEQQMELFDVLQDRRTADDLRKRRNDSLEWKMPKAVYYGNQRLNNLKASPNLNFITCMLVTSADPAPTQVPFWVTESGYVDPRNGRSKVGSPQDTYKMGIYDVIRDTFYTVDPRQIPGINDKPAFLREYHKDSTAYKPNYDKPREVIIHGPFFSEDGKATVVVRSADFKDRWIMRLDLASAKLDLIDRQQDTAWIGGPGIEGWTFASGNIGWIDNDRLFFQSVETGYSHLYIYSFSTGKKQALTSGQWEVRDVQLSNDRRSFYLTAGKEGPHERHFYRMPAEGGEMVRLTSWKGNNEVSISPDERYLAVRFSYSNKPWELYLMENRPGAAMRQVTRSTTAAFNRYSWREPEVVWFTAGDGARVPARLYRPVRAGKGGPAVIFVHGAGYLQNVHYWWSSYFREYMFHNLLADNGYTVLDIDYRGSDGYGRDWRTGIYRHMGGKDLSDHVDGAKFLISRYGVDPKRIGIYGGSYGGFITLMALFNAPETFRSGAALRAVTDWAHYNHGYTAAILNTPVEDPKAYERSSPLYFAEGLRGNLLILHGMVDTNVQFQDVVRLAQRLIELKKEHWEFAVFPVEDHGFVEPSSWADEYKRIFRLFQTTLAGNRK